MRYIHFVVFGLLLVYAIFAILNMLHLNEFYVHGKHTLEIGELTTL